MNSKVICETCGVLVDVISYEQHLKNGHNLQNSVMKMESNKDYKCYICGKVFTSGYNLNYHIAHHINARSFVCDECPKAYNTASDLAQHKRTHSNIAREPRMAKKSEPQACPFCSKSVLRLPMHIKLVHLNERNHNCEFCDKKFGKKGGLNRHILVVHKNVRNYKCEYCDKTFGEKSLLTRHQLIHSSVKTRFYCTICKKYVDEIKSHYKTAHVDMPFECEHCFRRFAKEREYKIHVDSKHVRLRKWLCDLCGSKFAEKYQLRRHFKSHINANGSNKTIISQYDEIFKMESTPKNPSRKPIVKKFACKICGKKFVCKSLVNAHLERHQHRKENYCNICKIYDDNIRQHYESEHKDLEFTCDICFKKFARNTQLKNHKLSNHIEHICDLCGEIYNNLTAIKTHIEAVHYKPEKIEQSDDDCDDSAVNQGANYENGSDFSEPDIKPNIKNINIESINIKKEPEDLYDESVHEKEVSIKNEQFSDPEDADDFDSDVTNSIKDEIDLEPEKVEETKHVKNRNDQEYKCNVCDQLYPTQDKFRLHFMPKHVKEIKTSFKCKPCNKTYKSKELILIHMRRSHRKLKNERPKPKSKQSEHSSPMCNFCGKTYTSVKTLKLHIKLIHSEKNIPCPDCGKKFSFISDMHRHKSRNHDNIRKHNCEKCPERFASTVELRLHINFHHNLNREDTCPEFTCFCGISFKTSFVLSRHKRIVHGDKDRNRECHICKEVLDTLHLKRKHMAIVHLNGKKLKRVCGYCKTEFTLFNDYKAHIESHNGMFICITCGEYHFDAESLKLHQSTHRSVDYKHKKYVCDHCGHRQFTKNALSLHMLKHVKECEMHFCDICGKGFKFSSSLYTHRKYHGEGEFECKQCNKKFARNAELVKHARLHTNEKPFRCQICDRGFTMKLLLQNHLQTHPETRIMLKCKACKQEFLDKNQLTVHENLEHPELRPFQCYICCMSFRHEHNLTKHNKHKHM